MSLIEDAKNKNPDAFEQLIQPQLQRMYRCNLRNYLYTYKNGEAVLLTPGAETIDDFYGYNKPFSYVERKGMVYCDYYYIYDFTTYNSETDMIDNVNDHIQCYQII